VHPERRLDVPRHRGPRAGPRDPRDEPPARPRGREPRRRGGYPRGPRDDRVDDGRADEAFLLLEQAYRLHRELGESAEVSTDVWRFAEALAAIGLAEEAVELGSLSAALREELGARVPWVERKTEETLAALRAQLDPAAFEQAWERGMRLTPDDAVTAASVMRNAR
jgi:hypothetical protein